MGMFDKLRQFKQNMDDSADQAQQGIKDTTKNLLVDAGDPEQLAQERSNRGLELAQGGANVVGSIGSVAGAAPQLSADMFENAAAKSDAFKRLLQKNVFRSPEETARLVSAAKTELGGSADALATGSPEVWNDLKSNLQFKKLRGITGNGPIK